MSSRVLRSFGVFTAGFGAVLAACLLLASSPTSGAEPKPACGDPTIIDYLAPFERFREPHPPPSGELSFGPRSLRLRQTALSQVIVDGRGNFGYVSQLDSRGSGSSRLGWHVTAKLEALSARGKVTEVSAKRRWRIGEVQRLDGREFFLRVKRSPALYRYLLDFRRADGQLLGRFTEYVRSLPQRRQVAVVSDKKTYRQGDRAVFQVANVGTVGVSYGLGGSVRFFNGSEWIPTMTLPSDGKRRAIVLGAGEGGACEFLRIPADLQPGEYRVEKRIAFLSGGGSRSVVRQFRVVP